MSTITFPGVSFQQIETPEEVQARVQAFLNEGGEPLEIVKHIAQMAGANETIPRINRILSFCFGVLKFNTISSRVNELFEAYLEMNKDFQLPLFCDAFRTGQYSLAEKLFDKGFEINAADPKTGATALHILVQEKNQQAVEWIFAHGGEADKKLVQDQRTALHIAASLKLKQVAQILLDHEADVNACSKHQFTPLHFAAIVENNSELLELLLDRGANLNAITSDGVNAFALAVLSNKNTLLRRGALQKPEIHYS